MSEPLSLVSDFHRENVRNIEEMLKNGYILRVDDLRKISFVIDLSLVKNDIVAVEVSSMGFLDGLLKLEFNSRRFRASNIPSKDSHVTNAKKYRLSNIDELIFLGGSSLLRFQTLPLFTTLYDSFSITSIDQSGVSNSVESETFRELLNTHVTPWVG